MKISISRLGLIIVLVSAPMVCLPALFGVYRETPWEELSRLGLSWHALSVAFLGIDMVGCLVERFERWERRRATDRMRHSENPYQSPSSF